MTYLTVTEAANRLNGSTRWVRKLITDGRLPATKHGRDWLIRADDLTHAIASGAVAKRTAGRPKKDQGD